MSHKPVPDFAETKLWVIRTTRKGSYGRHIPVDLAKADHAQAKTQAR